MDNDLLNKFWSESIAGLQLQEALVVRPDSSVSDAIRLMQNERKGCVCVVGDDGKIVGIFTERDVLMKFINQSLPEDAEVSAAMSTNPVTITGDTTLSEAVAIFHDKGFHHIPVLDAEGALTGLLSIRVVVDFVTENLPGEVLNLPPDSSIMSVQPSGG